MTANISPGRFAARTGVPVWWGFDGHHDGELGAEKALELFTSVPHHTLRPTFCELLNPDTGKKEMTQTPEFQLISRLDGQEHFQGTVTDAYNLITIDDVAKACDTATGCKPVETIGVIGNADYFFLTYELPTINVTTGDVEMKNYIMVLSPYKPGRGVKIVESSVVTVCQNTMRLALNTGVHHWTGAHSNKELELDLEAWLAHIMMQAETNIDLYREFTDAALGYQMQDGDLNFFLENTYPLPQEPDWVNIPQRIHERNQKSWEGEMKKAEAKRNTIADWYYNSTTGIGGELFGTGWHTVMAQTEVEDFWQSKKDPSMAILMGGRAANKRRGVQVMANLMGFTAGIEQEAELVEVR